MNSKDAINIIRDFLEENKDCLSDDLFESLCIAVFSLENCAHNCKKCKWYAEFEGVCTNGDNPLCADIIEYPELGCRYFDVKDNDSVS